MHDGSCERTAFERGAGWLLSQHGLAHGDNPRLSWVYELIAALSIIFMISKVTAVPIDTAVEPIGRNCYMNEPEPVA